MIKKLTTWAMGVYLTVMFVGGIIIISIDQHKQAGRLYYAFTKKKKNWKTEIRRVIVLSVDLKSCDIIKTRTKSNNKITLHLLHLHSSM